MAHTLVLSNCCLRSLEQLQVVPGYVVLTSVADWPHQLGGLLRLGLPRDKLPGGTICPVSSVGLH